MGGWSDERQVSIQSGQNVYRYLKDNNYKVEIFDLNKNKTYENKITHHFVYFSNVVCFWIFHTSTID